ncbi:MAG: hypothetical protein MZV64_49965 [Ignavibacteriales bacterium]|nr:hypothetical protein [Ignavibacteriales bacterium]
MRLGLRRPRGGTVPGGRRGIRQGGRARRDDRPARLGIAACGAAGARRFSTPVTPRPPWPRPRRRSKRRASPRTRATGSPRRSRSWRRSSSRLGDAAAAEASAGAVPGPGLDGETGRLVREHEFLDGPRRARARAGPAKPSSSSGRPSPGSSAATHCDGRVVLYACALAAAREKAGDARRSGRGRSRTILASPGDSPGAPKGDYARAVLRAGPARGEARPGGPAPCRALPRRSSDLWKRRRPRAAGDRGGPGTALSRPVGRPPAEAVSVPGPGMGKKEGWPAPPG